MYIIHYEHEGIQAYIPWAIYTSRAEGPRSICAWYISLYAQVRVVYNIYTYWLKLETCSKIFRALRKKKTKKEMTEGIPLLVELHGATPAPTLSGVPDIVSVHYTCLLQSILKAMYILFLAGLAFAAVFVWWLWEVFRVIIRALRCIWGVYGKI